MYLKQKKIEMDDFEIIFFFFFFLEFTHSLIYAPVFKTRPDM